MEFQYFSTLNLALQLNGVSFRISFSKSKPNDLDKNCCKFFLLSLLLDRQPWPGSFITSEVATFMKTR